MKAKAKIGRKLLMTIKISKTEAKRKGLKRFFTGEPCLHGHVCERMTVNGSCVECKNDRLRRRRHNPDVRKAETVYTRQWRKNNPEKQKEILRRARLKRFGITVHDYETLAKKQKHKCAICRKPENNKRRLAVDHCHQSGKVRALLCGACNNNLGVFELNKHKFEAYLARYGAS